MEVYEISPAVNRVANDAPALHEPYNADAVGPPAEKAEAGTEEAADFGQRAGLVILIGRRYRSIAMGPAPISPALRRFRISRGDRLANQWRG